MSSSLWVQLKKIECNVSTAHSTPSRVWTDLFYQHMAKEVFTRSQFSFLMTAGALMNVPDAPSLSIWKVMCSNLLFFFFFFISSRYISKDLLCSLWCNVHISSKCQNKVKLLLFPGGERVLECWVGRRGEVKLPGSDDGMVMWEIQSEGPRASPPGFLYQPPKRTFMPPMQHGFRGKQHKSFRQH